MKKNIIILIIIICSILFALTSDAFIVTAKDLIPFLFTILALSLTAYTFIYSPISQILEKKGEDKKIINKLEKLLKSFEEDMLLVFFLAIVIIFVDFVKCFDITIFKDINNIDLKIVQIKSLKCFITNFFIALSANFSFYAIYDLIQATFKILRKGLK